jgi:predicted ATPase with chaperone activity
MITTSDVPPLSIRLEDTGLGATFVQDLLLKVMYTQGPRMGQQLADVVRLPFVLLDEQLQQLQNRRMVEVRSAPGNGRAGYVFDLVAQGRERAQEALVASSYVGPAPVPLEQYCRVLEAQSVRKVHVSRTAVVSGFRHLVLEPAMLEVLGPAINSGKSLFLHGDSGNGKTVIADTIARLLGGSVYLPYAVVIDCNVVLVYDPVYHTAAAEPDGGAGTASIWRDGTAESDRRYVRVRRPVVIAGGELTLEDLDLRYEGHGRLYQAPFQMKASGGVLIIDDFGRQRVPPRELLNRWIVPLEKGEDYLTLHTGQKFAAPFDCLVIFATNLEPTSLVEEAFLRRIQYKVHVTDPTRSQYSEIFRRCCADRGIEFSHEGVRHIFTEFYGRRGIPARACHPRDILDHAVNSARFLEIEPALTRDLLNRACRSYFLTSADSGPGIDGASGEELDELDDERREFPGRPLASYTLNGRAHEP